MAGFKRSVLVLVVLGVTVPSASAHFNMLLPRTASAKRGEPVTFTYLWGHPFEHQLFDAPLPDELAVLRPNAPGIVVGLADKGKTRQSETAGANFRKIKVPATGGKTAVAYEFTYNPEQRGDFVFLLQTPPIWMDEDREFLQDTVKVVLHVQAQKGWDAVAPGYFEMLPLTRPYGLKPGQVFQVQVADNGKPLAGTLVEIEHYNPAPPKELPADEHITYTAKTDPNGVVSCTLADPGWWCLTAQRDGGQRAHEGKSYPVRRRTTFWVFVDDKIPSGAAR